MEKQLYGLLRQSSVRISIPGKIGHGTGFFVAPGLVLTCAHVVKAALPSTNVVEVYWNGQLYSGQITIALPDPDLALLQVKLTDHPCVYLHEDVTPFDALYSYGYSDDHPNGDPTTFSFEGEAGEQGEQLKFKAGQVRPGMSGAPLLNVRTGHVCGIIQLTRDRNANLGGRAIPIATVFREISELVDQQKRFHQLDRRWLNCCEDVFERMKYLEGLSKRYGSVKLLINSVEAENFSLQAVFQPLKLRKDPSVAEDLEREERRPLLGEPTRSDNDSRITLPEKDKQPMFAEDGVDALQKSPQGRMVVLGGPGTGKSTVLKYLADEASRKAQNDYAALIPIFISLPEFAYSGKTLQRYLPDIVSDMGTDDRYADVLWRAIKDKQALICLDGLDEVPPSQRRKIIESINTWASGEGNCWIVSTRFTEYKSRQFKQNQFTEWELQPMDHVVRQNLAQRLLPQLSSAMYESNQIALCEPSTFVNLLEAHPHAAAWGENPLLFSLAAAIFVFKGVLPSSRSVLYQQVIDAVLETRAQHRTQKKVLRRVIAGLALRLHEINRQIFTHDDLLTLLPVIREEQHENWDTEEIANRIVVSGTLEVVAREIYGFRHQTFQEYLAAVGLGQRLLNHDHRQREKAWTLAWVKRTYSRWTEILILFVGVLTQEFDKTGIQEAQRWLQALVRLQVTPDGDPGDLALSLAVKSLPEMMASVKDDGIIEQQKEIVRVWVRRLLEVARGRRRTRLERLTVLRDDVSSLSPLVVEVAIEPLVAVLADDQYDVSQTAKYTLALLRKQGITEPRTTTTRNVQAEHLTTTRNRKEIDTAEVKTQKVPEEQWTVTSLMAALRAKDWKSRVAAVRAVLSVLGEQELEPVTLLLFPALHDPSPEVRLTTVKELSRLQERISVEILLASLSDSDPRVRIAVIRILGKLGKRAPVAALVRTLDDQKMDVRCAAVEALGELGERAPIEALIHALDDQKMNVRLAAVQALGELGERAPIEPLMAALSDREVEVRLAVMLVLNKLKIGVQRELWINALNDSQWSVRLTAIQLVGAIKEKASVEDLKAALYDPHPSVCLAALQALEIYGEQMQVEALVTALKNTNAEVRKAVMRMLNEPGKQAPKEPLMVALHDSEWQIRLAAARMLGVPGEQAPVEALLVALGDEDQAVRGEAMQVLRNLGKRVPVDLLVSALKDKNVAIQEAAATLLGGLGDRAPVEPLVAALYTDYSKNTAAAQALGALGERALSRSLVFALCETSSSPVRNKVRGEAVIQVLETVAEIVSTDVLLAVLRNNYWKLQEAAIEILDAVGEQAPLEPLLAAFGQQDPRESLLNTSLWTRAAVVLSKSGERVPTEILTRIVLSEVDGKARKRAAQALGDHVPTALLIATLRDGSKQNRYEILRSLNDLIPTSALVEALNDRDHEVSAMAAYVLGTLGERAPIEPLVSILSDKSGWGWRRADAARVLGKLGQRAPLDSLVAALLDSDLEVRQAAALVLGELGEPASIEALIVALHDRREFMRKAAVLALGKLGEHVPVEALVTMLDDKDKDVRIAAIQVLGTLGDRSPVGSLIAALNHPEQDVWLSAVRVLAVVAKHSLTEFLITALNRTNGSLYETAVRALAIMAELFHEELLKVGYEMFVKLIRDYRVGDIREMTVLPAEILGKMAEEMRAKVREMPLDSNEANIALMQVFCELEERVPIEPLIAALNNPKPELRRAGVKALAVLGKREPIELLTEALSDPDSNVHAAAVWRLIILNKLVPAELVAGVLNDPGYNVYASAAWMLIVLGEPVPVPELVSIINGIDANVRRVAAQALGTLGGRASAKALTATINDRHRWWRANVALKVGEFGASALIEPIIFALGNKDVRERRSAVETLQMLGELAPIEPLVAALGDSDKLVRRGAVLVLQHINPDALSSIIPEATAILSNREAATVLGSLAQAFVAKTLGEMNHITPRLLDHITSLLNWPYWEVRMEASTALCKLCRNISDSAIHRLLELRHDPQSQAVRDAADDALAELLLLEPGVKDD